MLMAIRAPFGAERGLAEPPPDTLGLHVPGEREGGALAAKAVSWSCGQWKRETKAVSEPRRQRRRKAKTVSHGCSAICAVSIIAYTPTGKNHHGVALKQTTKPKPARVGIPGSCFAVATSPGMKPHEPWIVLLPAQATAAPPPAGQGSSVRCA